MPKAEIGMTVLHRFLPPVPRMGLKASVKKSRFTTIGPIFVQLPEILPGNRRFDRCATAKRRCQIFNRGVRYGTRTGGVFVPHFIR